MNIQKIKNDKWYYVRARELNILIISLIDKSYRLFFSKYNLNLFEKYFVNSTYICSRNFLGKTFRKKSNIQRLVEILEKLDPKIIRSIYKQERRKIKAVKEEIKFLMRLVKTARDLENFKKIYLRFRKLFLDFFPFQVFPLLCEDILSRENKNSILKKYINLFVKWRKETHAIELELEDLLFLFLNKIKKKTGLDFNPFTDQELIRFLNKKKIDKKNLRKISRREKFCLMVWKSKKMQIFTNKKAEIVCKYLSEIVNKDLEKQDLLVGKNIGINKKIKGKVYLIMKKKDFKEIPNNSIIVARAIELDDIAILKTKKIKGVIIEERAGLTSHIAIMAREFKIPILSGVKNVFGYLKANDLVEINSDRAQILNSRP